MSHVYITVVVRTAENVFDGLSSHSPSDFFYISFQALLYVRIIVAVAFSTTHIERCVWAIFASVTCVYLLGLITQVIIYFVHMTIECPYETLRACSEGCFLVPIVSLSESRVSVPLWLMRKSFALASCCIKDIALTVSNANSLISLTISNTNSLISLTISDTNSLISLTISNTNSMISLTISNTNSLISLTISNTNSLIA